MDKNAIKKYAIWARNELIARIAQRALKYGISKDNIVDAYADSINGVLLSAVEKSQRQVLIAQIEAKGFEQVVEEVAYTWFNRLCAIRFMEVNGYLPSGIRVLSDEDNNFKPQILAQAINLDIEEIDMERVYVLKEANKDEELYRYLLIAQCNALNKILPYMFQKLEDYTELLLPDNLLREGSVIERLVSEIPQEDFIDYSEDSSQVEIIGWLYQFYNIVPKKEVESRLENGEKVSKVDLPAKTQLFTPDWIVRYMVENSLGRMWVEGHPNDELKVNWKYYLEEAKQEADVEAELVKIRNQYAQLDPKDIKVIDPCMGSGHILVYAFDVLMQIYTNFGYTEKEATISILENNLYGLDIDERAYQLAYFAVMMKARKYHKFIFKKEVQCNIHSIVESNGVNVEHLQYFGARLDELNKNIALTQMQCLLHQMHDAKEYGSLITVDNYDWNLLHEFVDEFDSSIGSNLFNTSGIEQTQALLRELVAVGEVLAQKYSVVVTNPPYMGVSKGSVKLNDFVKNFYKDSKSDLYSVFIERCLELLKQNGFTAMITMQGWMFQGSYELLRNKLLNYNFINMVHLGARAFEEIAGEVVQTTSFVIRNNTISFKTIFNDVTSYNTQDEKKDSFLRKDKQYIVSTEKFKSLPGNNFAYQITVNELEAFNHNLGKVFDCKTGLICGNNKKYIRCWFEVVFETVKLDCDSLEKTISKWYPYNHGGNKRKWYGEHNDVVLLENNALLMRSEPNAAFRNSEFYFKKGLTWNRVGSGGNFASRVAKKGFVFDDVSPTGFCSEELYYILIAYLNSCVFNKFLSYFCTKLKVEIGQIKKVPYKIINEHNVINNFAIMNIEVAKKDWDSFETSWDFAKHPLLPSESNTLLENCYKEWKAECEERFNQLKANEEELNRIFIEIYGLQDELTPEVEDKDVTVRKADLEREIKSLISYAVGCMFGRYSLDVEGLAYAGGEWDASKYTTFIPDDDNVIPITDDEYFEDDIVGRFINWLKVVYGEETLDENLQFIANALGGRGTAKEIIRKYFVNDFYKDHCKIYQKRPIYWLFDSGKKNGFKALIYMHRYAPDTIARIRTDYVHEQQARYRTLLATLEQRLDSASTKERVAINKEIAMYKDKESELHTYEEKIHHLADQMISIDLDDGVKNNYAIFGDVLAKI